MDKIEALIRIFEDESEFIINSNRNALECFFVFIGDDGVFSFFDSSRYDDVDKKINEIVGHKGIIKKSFGFFKVQSYYSKKVIWGPVFQKSAFIRNYLQFVETARRLNAVYDITGKNVVVVSPAEDKKDFKRFWFVK